MNYRTTELYGTYWSVLFFHQTTNWDHCFINVPLRKQTSIDLNWFWLIPLQWCHNEHNGVINHLHLDCFLSNLFSRRWKKSSKLLVTGLCAGNSPVIDEFPAQRASNTENVSIWCRHHPTGMLLIIWLDCLIPSFEHYLGELKLVCEQAFSLLESGLLRNMGINPAYARRKFQSRYLVTGCNLN